MTASPEHVDDRLPAHPESHFQSGEEALSHLDDVIEFVVSEAIDYADKPPEERTLPKLTRKAPPPPARPRNSMVIGNLNQMRPDMAANGINRMPILGASAQFQQKLHTQLPTMVPFNASPQQQQQLLMQYNGQYQAQPAHSQQQQQYAQAAHFQALQNQQAQYQAANAAALAQMQQLQRQQLQGCRKQFEEFESIKKKCLESAFLSPKRFAGDSRHPQFHNGDNCRPSAAVR
ncbi:hypothetical protein P879_03984 [Paragonimus westermani]|uniref:Uncharacterized protein n=1 Tax=Paragonimus westermani TaxID=34504 RepID=A0A8T0DRL0_9TREM|nr:hypothetical protein P879_03984 [Paragonimus westermani]